MSRLTAERLAEIRDVAEDCVRMGEDICDPPRCCGAPAVVQNAEAVLALLAEVDALRAEAQQLREALEQIERRTTTPYQANPMLLVDDTHYYALTALAGSSAPEATERRRDMSGFTEKAVKGAVTRSLIRAQRHADWIGGSPSTRAEVLLRELAEDLVAVVPVDVAAPEAKP